MSQRQWRVLVYQGSPSGGGSKRSLMGIVQVLREMPNVDLLVVCSARGWFSQRLEELQIPYTYVAGLEALNQLTARSLRANPLASIWQLARLFPGLVRLWATFARARAEILLINESRDVLQFLPFLLRDKPMTIFRSGVETELHSPLGRFVCRRASRVLAVSDAVRRHLIEGGIPAEKVDVVPGLVDVSLRTGDSEAPATDLRKELGVEESARLVGYVAAIHPRKGQLDLVRMFAELRKELSDVHLVLAGSVTSHDARAREYERSIVQAINDYNLTGWVHLLGWREDVHQWLGQLDAMVMPTYQEGLPRVAVEALWAGVPIVGYDIPSMHAVVRPGQTGFLVPVGEVGLLQERTREILVNPELRALLSQKSKDLWRQHFSPATVKRQTESVFQRIFEACEQRS